MPNKQLSKQAKVKRVERQQGARATDDPDGVLHVLLTARRLLAEGGDLLKDGWQEQQSRNKPNKYGFMGALRAAVHLAHPRDASRAIWNAQFALQSALNVDETAANGMAHMDDPVITRWESHPDTTLADALRVYDRAIKAQGTVNTTVSKSKGRK